MDPVAFHFGSFSIRWYGIFFALGFLAGYLLLQKRAKSSRLGTEAVADLTLLAMAAGIIGARALYVAENWGDFAHQRLEILRIDHGGLVFYGGFIAAALALLVVSLRKKYVLGEVADIVTPALPLAHAFGRLGCFFNGCCFGRPTTSACGWHYPAGSDVMLIQKMKGVIPPDAVAAAPVLPVQLFEAGFNLLLCVVLLALEKRLPRRGQLFAVYLACYAAGRFVLEGMRGDYPDNQLLFGLLTPGRSTALLLFPFGIALYFLWNRFGEKRPAA